MQDLFVIVYFMHLSYLNHRYLKQIFISFNTQGVTAFAMLAESHISIHTWPEEGVAKCDIFTCSDKCKPEKAVEYLGEAFEAEQIDSDTFDRLL